MYDRKVLNPEQNCSDHYILCFIKANVFACESAMLKLLYERRKWGESKGAGRGRGERRENAWKHCKNEKLPLISRTWPLFLKWVADNNKTTKQSLQSKDSHYLKKNKLDFIIVFILTGSQCNSPQLMKLQFKLQFILLNSYLQIAIRESLTQCKQFKKLMSWAQRDTTLQENITFLD